MTATTRTAPPILPRTTPDALRLARRQPIDPDALRTAREIIDDVRARGLAAVEHHARRLGDLRAGDPLVYSAADLRRALDRLDPSARAVLERAAERIRTFAIHQRAALHEFDIPVPGGVAGLRVVPMHAAGCYAPGGRFPLPSSVLMTAIPARVAGVAHVWGASPRPPDVTLAAASIAGADGLLGVGGPHALAALAFGLGGSPACDVLVGPGNAYVTAAKSILAAERAIDMLAGPSEVLIIADDTADPAVIAADLLAQAEHDPQAIPMLLTTSDALLALVDDALRDQLATFPAAGVARQALATGFACLVPDLAAAAALADTIAPEHLQLMTRDDAALAQRVSQFGTLFIGPRAAEVLGDYAIGPNHTLPTGGTPRHASGLSVMSFLTLRTWVRTDTRDEPFLRDVAAFARLEGLEGHARAAEARLAMS